MRAVPYKTSDYLKTPEAIAEYLKAVLEDSESDHEDLLIALRNIDEAASNQLPTTGPSSGISDSRRP
jgi:DNA-binding phage protein